MALSIDRPSSVLSDYCLDRLFDPDNLYYLPIEELVNKYKTRDLIPGKLYNISKRYHNESEYRRRLIIAPNMERVRHQYTNYEKFYRPPEKIYLCSKPKNISNTDDYGFNKTDASHESEAQVISYEDWLKNRKKLMNNLKNMSLNMEYLKRKKDLTDMEKRVLKKLMHTDKQIQTDPEKRKKLIRNKSADRPKIICPTPLAIERIEQVKQEKKWRLVDIFKDLDKNKDWRLHKEDFVRECKRGNLNVTDAMVDELLMAYGTYHKKLDYKMMAKGRTSLLNDQRRNIKESHASFSYTGDTSTSTQLNTPRELSFESTNLSFNVKQSREKFQSDLNMIPEIKSANEENHRRYLRVPNEFERLQAEKYPEMLDRSTSAHSIYSVKLASDALQTQIKLENLKAIDKVAEFRARLHADYEHLVSSLQKLNKEERLNSVAKAFSYPEETDRAAILKTIRLKEKKRRMAEREADRERKEALRKAKMEEKNNF